MSRKNPNWFRHGEERSGRTKTYKSAAKKAGEYVRHGLALENEGSDSSAAVWFEKGSRAYKIAGNLVRARMWHNRAQTIKNRRAGYPKKGKKYVSRDVSSSGDSAIFYSGQLTIRVRYIEPKQGHVDERSRYRVSIYDGKKKIWSDIVGSPVGGHSARKARKRLSVDSNLAYRKAAEAGLSFADYHDSSIGERAQYSGKEGFVLRNWKRK